MAIRSFAIKRRKTFAMVLLLKGARKQLPSQLHEKARIELARIAAASDLGDLSELRGNHFEMLKGDRVGQFSIRINDQYRICFRWQDNDAHEVDVTDYH